MSNGSAKTSICNGIPIEVYVKARNQVFEFYFHCMMGTLSWSFELNQPFKTIGIEKGTELNEALESSIAVRSLGLMRHIRQN